MKQFMKDVGYYLVIVACAVAAMSYLVDVWAGLR
jgi:hypothetical protein